MRGVAPRSDGPAATDQALARGLLILAALAGGSS